MGVFTLRQCSGYFVLQVGVPFSRGDILLPEPCTGLGTTGSGIDIRDVVRMVSLQSENRRDRRTESSQRALSGTTG